MSARNDAAAPVGQEKLIRFPNRRRRFSPLAELPQQLRLERPQNTLWIITDCNQGLHLVKDRPRVFTVCRAKLKNPVADQIDRVWTDRDSGKRRPFAVSPAYEL